MSEFTEIPWSLVERYDRPLPRYTSYPTVPHWCEATAPSVVEGWDRVASGEARVSVYVHVPFCHRMCLYCGCNTTVTKRQDVIERYVDALCMEIAQVRARVGAKPLAQLHFGGGTPSLLPVPLLERLLGAIYDAFAPTEDAEISMELDPTVTTAQHYPALRAMGFNRVSLGVQDFDDSVQSAIGRDQWSSVSYEAFERARCAGFDSINLDLLYGLPLQSTAHLERSAQSVAELGADRVAIFGYAHVPWMKPHQKKLERYGLPSGESRWEMFQAARRVFYAAGYEPVGFDHFAKPDDELVQHSGCLNRNFQGYTVLDPMPVLAFGASAIADLSDRFVQNEKRLSAYMDAVFEGRPAAERMCIRGEDDEVRRALITEFMCNMELHGCTLPQAQADVFRGVLSTPNPVLDELVADELVRISRDRLAVTERGRAFLRVVASVFDAYLECPTEARFSHAV